MKKAAIIAVLFTCMLFVGCGRKNNIDDKASIKSSKSDKQVDKTTSNKVKEVSYNTSGIKSNIEDKWDFTKYKDLEDIVSIKKIPIKNEDIVTVDVEAYEIIYKSDNLKISAYLAVPKSIIEKNASTPCVIFNRDGYMDYDINTSTTIVDLASYFNAAVFATQYRGNSSSEGKDAFGGEDVHDVIKLIDLCQKFAFIDLNRLYMTGIGRGGMMTYIVAASDKRIKKIAVKGAYSDLFLLAEQRWDLHQMFKDSVGGMPIELPTEFQARSGIHIACNINCPVLIMHGRYDSQVNYVHATKMAESLANCGKSYQLITNENDVNGYQSTDFLQIKSWFELQ